MPSRQTAIRLLTRFTDRLGGRTIYFTADALGGRTGRCKLTFIDPEHVPPFEGHEAWFELERMPGTPWAYWRAIRQVDPPPDWVPSPPPRKKHPRELMGPR